MSEIKTYSVHGAMESKNYIGDWYRRKDIDSVIAELDKLKTENERLQKVIKNMERSLPHHVKLAVLEQKEK